MTAVTVLRVAYQPHNHLIWLELARNGILIAVAAFAVLASVWWLRIRPATEREPETR